MGRLMDWILVSREPGEPEYKNHSEAMLNNYDLKPVEPARRTWGAWNFVGFWVSDAFNINTWMIISSSVVGGLSWWEAWICVWVGYLVTACFVCASGRIGAIYHVSFPPAARASFGIWGSLWPVLNRGVMAAIWYGVQSWIGGECVLLMLRSIWPSANTMPNSLPASSGTNTRDFVCFFLFWLFQLPFIWFPVHQIRHLFTVKAFIVPTAGVAFFIWSIVKAHGIGPIVKQGGTLSGSEKGWAIVSAIMNCIANFATLIVNDPDFTRFAKKPRDALWSQLVTIPVAFAITSFIGVIVSSSSTVIYGEAIWNPTDLLKMYLNDAPTSGTRAGVFFIAFALALAQLGTNIAANSVSSGSDLTALCPRLINIRRGGYIAAIVGICMCPWNLLSSSNNFTTYLSAYSVFLSSIAGVILGDYYWVRKGYLKVEDLYSANKNDSYWYTYGIGLKAYVAYIAGILINVVGFANAVGSDVPMGAVYIYRLNFFTGFIVASCTYAALCKIWPSPDQWPSEWSEVGSEAYIEGKEYERGAIEMEAGSEQLAYDKKGFTEAAREREQSF
ncbi:uracil permease [Saitoella coloradoensis]